MALRWIRILLLCLAATTLAACSTTRVVEGEVQSYSRLAAIPNPPTYRIDRLPSQQAPSFDAIAALADQALNRAGLRRDDAAPRLLVQIGIQADTIAYHDPYNPPPWAFGGWRRGSWGARGLWRHMGDPAPLYRRTVNLVLRDAATQAIVYETSAVHEDIWTADPAVYGLLLDAALSGFPQPPAGVRQVRIPFAPAP